MILKKLKLVVISLIVAFSGSLIVVPAVASAATFVNDACSGVNATAGSTSATCSTTGATSIGGIIRLVINILSILVGVTAVIMVILGGFKFITSSGDSNNTASARNTILYAVIGLIVVALAQILVHFVLSSTSTAITCANTKGPETNKVCIGGK